MKKLTIGFLQTHTEIQQTHVKQIIAAGKISGADITVKVYKDLAAILKEAATLDIIVGHRLPEELFKKATRMKWFHALSAGVDTVVALLKNSNITLTNSSGVHPINIAEHVFGMMLMHCRELNRAWDSQKRKEWVRSSHEEVSELYGKHMLIVGYGAIGRQIAKVGKAFGMEIVGMKRTAAKDEFAEIITEKDLPRYLPNADYIVVALPSTPGTIKFLDSKRLSALKDTAIIINIGRGDVIDEKAMTASLKKRKSMAALLDVFEEEPLPASSELWSMPNVFITAHYSGHTPEYMNRAVAIFCDNLKAYLQGKEMPTLVNKELGY